MKMIPAIGLACQRHVIRKNDVKYKAVKLLIGLCAKSIFFSWNTGIVPECLHHKFPGPLLLMHTLVFYYVFDRVIILHIYLWWHTIYIYLLDFLPVWTKQDFWRLFPTTTLKTWIYNICLIFHKTVELATSACLCIENFFLCRKQNP